METYLVNAPDRWTSTHGKLDWWECSARTGYWLVAGAGRSDPVGAPRHRDERWRPRARLSPPTPLSNARRPVRFVSPRLPWLDLALGERVGCLALDQSQSAREQVGGLVLPAVVLQREGVTRVDDEELAGVAVGMRPPDLVSAGFSTRFGFSVTVSSIARKRSADSSLSACGKGRPTRLSRF